MNGPIIEAFPNAFLAVLLPDHVFAAATKLRRGRRFDWLYERVLENEGLISGLRERLNLPDSVWDRLCVEKDHEKRAAIICLITAAFAFYQAAEVVGNANGGWFWMPHRSLWQEWAIEGLRNSEERCELL